MTKRRAFYLLLGALAMLVFAVALSRKRAVGPADPNDLPSLGEVRDRNNFAAKSATLPRMRPENRAALLMLANADIFISDRVGASAATPSSVRAFRRPFNDPRADAAFKELISSAPLAPQLYGLCGVYLTDLDSFPVLVRPFENNSEPVPTAEDCIFAKKPVSTIVSVDIIQAPHVNTCGCHELMSDVRLSDYSGATRKSMA
jgi:hypothetical protein